MSGFESTSSTFQTNHDPCQSSYLLALNVLLGTFGGDLLVSLSLLEDRFRGELLGSGFSDTDVSMHLGSMMNIPMYLIEVRFSHNNKSLCVNREGGWPSGQLCKHDWEKATDKCAEARLKSIDSQAH
jgi:hypothetical protein